MSLAGSRDQKGQNPGEPALYEFTCVAWRASDQEEFHTEKYKRPNHNGKFGKAHEAGISFLMLGIVHGRVAV